MCNSTRIKKLQTEYRAAMARGDVHAMGIAIMQIDRLRLARGVRLTTSAVLALAGLR